MFKSRLDSFLFQEGKRIKIPSFVNCIRIHSFRSKKREQSRVLYEEHPCTKIELIGEGFDSIPWLCVISLCVDVMLINICFLLCTCLYMLCM
jgi:hypothetical protein